MHRRQTLQKKASQPQDAKPPYWYFEKKQEDTSAFKSIFCFRNSSCARCVVLRFRATWYILWGVYSSFLWSTKFICSSFCLQRTRSFPWRHFAGTLRYVRTLLSTTKASIRTGTNPSFRPFSLSLRNTKYIGVRMKFPKLQNRVVLTRQSQH